MCPSIATDRAPAPVQKGEILTYEKLQKEVEAALAALDRPQYKLAAEMGKSPSAISNAAKNVGPRYSRLQVQILQHLAPKYELEDVGGYRVKYA